MDISLAKLPWYAQIGAFVALAVAGSGAFFYYYEMPARADIASRENQLHLIKGDITKGLATAKKLDEFRNQVEDLEARLVKLKAVLPEEKDAAELLRGMENIAVQSHLTIKLFKPSPTVTQELHAEWPIAMEFDGSYHNLALFFNRIGKFTRIVNVSGLVIDAKNKTATTNSTVTAKCIATTFVLLDPAAAPPPTKAKAKPKPAPKAPAAKKAA